MNEEKEPQRIAWERLKATTNFYPAYVDGNRDKVTAILSTRATKFQTVVPRYNLSMSETRNEGTGPFFLETEYHTPAYRQDTKIHSKAESVTSDSLSFKLPRHKKKKIRTDFWG